MENIRGKPTIIDLGRDPNELLEDARQTFGVDDVVYHLIKAALRETPLSLSGIITPIKKVSSGLLVQSTVRLWGAIARTLDNDWTRAYEIPSEKWEEIVAGAFDAEGFDEVILTPRSGDHGRDVIATKKGRGSIKIIGSVKAYRPDHLVGYDDVRALLGVLGAERDASKAIITTTSDFPPRIEKDPFIAPYLPSRLELVNGEKLKAWLATLAAK